MLAWIGKKMLNLWNKLKQRNARRLQNLRKNAQDERVHSLDAMRGFWMLFVLGAGGLISLAANLFWPQAAPFLSEQIEHAKWNGFTFLDAGLPAFLFISGATFPFSFAGFMKKELPRLRACLNSRRE